VGTLETVLLTGAIVVIDVLVLSEYLKLEEELRKIKELAGQATTSNLDSIAQQVVEPLSNIDTVQLATSASLQSFNADAIITESNSVPAKTDAERENEKLKAENQALTTSRSDTHNQQLDEIGDKIDEIVDGVKNAKEKVAQYS